MSYVSLTGMTPKTLCTRVLLSNQTICVNAELNLITLISRFHPPVVSSENIYQVLLCQNFADYAAQQLTM
jgi:hypothetical protein